MVRLPQLLLVMIGTLVFASCSRSGPTAEQAHVAQAFTSWKSAVVGHQNDQALAYIPRHVDDYLVTLRTDTKTAPVSDYPGVDLLLRTAIAEKVPADLRPKLTLNLLLQRMTDRHLLKTSDVEQIALGSVSVNGNHASAVVYYQGALTAFRLPFIKEDDAWKIDVLAILPYAEMLMRVDRAIKKDTETEQVNQLVARLPSL